MRTYIILYITSVGDVAYWRLWVFVLVHVGFVAEHPTPAETWGSIPRSCEDVHAFVCVVSARGVVASTMVDVVNCANLELHRLGNSWNDVDEGLGLLVFDFLGIVNLHLHRHRAFQFTSYAYLIFMETN